VYDGQPSPETRNVTRLNPNGSIDHSFTSQATFSQYGGVQRIMFLDNLEVLVFDDNDERQPTKLHANGSLDTEFIDNYNTMDIKYESHEKVVRFGDRIIMGAYYFYNQGLITDVFYEDGQIDTGFSLPVSVGQFYDFYADNDHELFILGDISQAGSSKPWQMAKILFAPSDALARAPIDQNPGLLFSPNPVRNLISINNTEEAMLTIYSLSGEPKITTKVTPGQQIDVSKLPQGHYVIQMITNGRSYKQHLIKD
jgi:hypothetical protein